VKKHATSLRFTAYINPEFQLLCRLCGLPSKLATHHFLTMDLMQQTGTRKPAKKRQKRSQSTVQDADTSTASGTNDHVRWSDSIPHNQRFTEEQVKRSNVTLTLILL